MLTRVSSAMPTTETSDDALSKRMNSLMSGGTEIFNACGRRMRRQISSGPKPSAVAASPCPRGTALSAPRRISAWKAAEESASPPTAATMAGTSSPYLARK